MSNKKTQWFVKVLSDLTRQMVFEYLNSIGQSDNAEEFGKMCSDGRKRDLVRVPWEAIPLLWARHEASFHSFSAEGNSRPEHTKMFCCERGPKPTKALKEARAFLKTKTGR